MQMSYCFSQNYIKKIPGFLIAYWMGNGFVKLFENEKKLGDKTELNCGIKTGNNELFLRYWHEIDDSKTCHTPHVPSNGYKWFYYNKGGGYQKWYGGYEHVIDFEKKGDRIKTLISKDTYRLREPKNYFHAALIWPLIGDIRFSAREMPSNVLPDIACNAIFDYDYCLLGYMNSKPFNECMKFINSTVSYPIDSVANVPIKSIESEKVDGLTKENVELSKKDWDSFENSWEFKRHPLI